MVMHAHISVIKDALDEEGCIQDIQGYEVSCVTVRGRGPVGQRGRIRIPVARSLRCSIVLED